MITMAEIDGLRAEVKLARQTERDPGRWPRIHGDEARKVVRAAVETAEQNVTAALVKWWAQGCREPRPADEGEPAVRELARWAGVCDCPYAPCQHDLAKALIDANRVAQGFKAEADKARGLAP
jgi:hypothetical protein